MHLFRRRTKEARRTATKPGLSVGRCRRHPKHCQSPGVCSLCLRERLVHLDAPARVASLAGSSGESSSAASSVSSYSSSLGSSCSSPVRDRSSKASVSSLLFGSALKKSRSLAFAPRSTRLEARAVDDVTKENRETYRERNTGFWSKLLNNHKRTDRGFSLGLHSKTVRERSSVTLIEH